MAIITGSNVQISYSSNGFDWHSMQAISVEANLEPMTLGEKWVVPAATLQPLEWTIEIEAKTIDQKITLIDLCSTGFDGTIN